MNMKVEEKVQNYPSKMKEYTNYCVREIKHVCKTFDKRGSGSEGEKQAQEYFAKHMESVSDEVAIEPFSLHPAAFYGWIIVSVLCMFAGILIYNFWMPIIALPLLIFSVSCIIFEFLMYKQYLDPFFPKKESRNVIARHKPTGEIKKRVIFSGHSDAAHEWTFTHLGGGTLLKIAAASALASPIIAAIITLIAVLFGNITSIPESGTFKILGYIMFALFIPGVAVLFFNNWFRVVDGANDNLTGVAASMAMIRLLNDHDIRFENTEVIAVLTGSEEAGLRGAKSFAKTHKEELSDPNVESVFIGLETLRDYDHMAIYSRDMTGTVQNDLRVCALVKEGAKRAGYDLPYESVFFGSSDAAAISQAGFPATTLASMDPTPARYYHTRRDTADNLDKKTIQKALEITTQTMFLFDEQGLKELYD